MKFRKIEPPAGANPWVWESACGSAAYSLLGLHLANTAVPGDPLWAQEEMQAIFENRAKNMYASMTENGTMPYEMRSENFQDNLALLSDKIKASRKSEGG